MWAPVEIWTHPIVVSFGIACAAALILTLATMRWHHDQATVGIGVLLLALWAFSKVSIIQIGYWPTAAVGPFVNTVAVVICMLSWVARPRWWKLALGLLMEAKAVLHAVFWAMPEPSYDQTYAYIFSLNIIFAAELACVSMPGGRVVASLVGDRVRRLRGAADHRLPSSGGAT